MHSSKGQLNLLSANTSSPDTILSSRNSAASTSESEIYNNSNLLWNSSLIVDKLGSLNNATNNLSSPIYSNDPTWSDKSFTKFEVEGQSPRILRSKEETAPLHLFSEYWSTHWANTPMSHRVINNVGNSLANSTFYLPSIIEYSEYDFKNWQASEALEDCFWESNYSSFVQDEYLSILSNAQENELLKRQEELYNTSTRAHKFKGSKLYSPLKPESPLVSPSFFSNNGFLNTTLTAKKDFLYVHNDSLLDLLDDSYESLKSSSLSNSVSNKSPISSYSYNINPYSYTRIIDPFRADYEELLWGFDKKGSSEFDSSISDYNESRVSNSMKLRSTARNAIVSYNAMQKVFKSRLDEGRSHSRLQDFTNSYTSHNFITAPKAKYESILSKTKNTFFDVNFYNHSLNDNLNLLSSVYNSLNSILLDIPFLVSEKSDFARYLWFDW